MPRVSIVMPYYNRPMQLEYTIRSIRAQKADCEVIVVPDVRDHSEKKWLNPAPLWNQGIDRARGEILILQSPECKHQGNVIERLSEVEKGQALFASCMALNWDGSENRWYTHPEHRREPWFFCGSLYKSDCPPFDESFTEYGGEDLKFAAALEKNGVRFLWRDDIIVQHQWHEHTGGVGL